MVVVSPLLYVRSKGDQEVFLVVVAHRFKNSDGLDLQRHYLQFQHNLMKAADVCLHWKSSP